ncbi:MAG: hypothetical protein L0H93_17070, partial [Nocardioides sp.]|nr:hypothetical protein [Nocardioides sp.]
APRLLRKMATGMVTPDAAEAIQSERALIDQVRSRQTDRRVVTLISGKGGVGCTTVALALGTVLMAMRDDRTVLVDVQQGTPSLGALSDVGAPRTVSSLLTETEVVDPPLAASGLGVVDGADWDQRIRRDDIAGVLELLGREHTFNLLDAGNDPGDGGHTALARADQVVVVTGPGPMGAAAMRTAHDRVREVNQMAVAGVITVVVCQTEDAHRETQRQLRNTPRTVVLPPDPHLAAGRPMDASAVSGATREAMLRVTALVASRTTAHG